MKKLFVAALVSGSLMAATAVPASAGECKGGPFCIVTAVLDIPMKLLPKKK